jgi:hypothetical protein
VLNGLYLLYTSQNLLGMIFRVTFTVFYRRIWSIVGKYSILCCDIVYYYEYVQLQSLLHEAKRVRAQRESVRVLQCAPRPLRPVRAHHVPSAPCHM